MLALSADREWIGCLLGKRGTEILPGEAIPLRNKVETFCAWGGVVAALGFGLSLVSAHFLPPISPALSAAEVKAVFLDNTSGIKVGAIIMLAALTGFLTLYVGISLQIRRMNGAFSRQWSMVQLALGGFSLVPVYTTALCWALAAYRPDRSPEAIQLLNDIAWFNLVMPVTPALVQMWAIGFATLSDHGDRLVYPRWYGFVAFWVGVLLMTGLLVPFFTVGLFAWNGLLAFWLPAVALGTFVLLTTILMLRAARM